MFLVTLIDAQDFKRYDNKELPVETFNWTFKDYIKKFQPSHIWRNIEENNKQNGINRTFKDEFEKILNLTDETDELLDLMVDNGNPTVLLSQDGRRWRPPGKLTQNKHDFFSVRRRILELMKQAIYQTRNKMIPMQFIRKKYSKISVYKMGFLTSKTDTTCKTFSTFAYKSFKACTMSRQKAVKTYYVYDKLEANERLLNLWFDIDLLVDLMLLNHENCKRMMQQVMTNRKHAWKFVD